MYLSEIIWFVYIVNGRKEINFLPMMVMKVVVEEYANQYHLESSEPKSVNSILNIIVVDSLRLVGLHYIKIKFSVFV